MTGMDGNKNCTRRKDEQEKEKRKLKRWETVGKKKTQEGNQERREVENNEAKRGKRVT